MLDAGVNLSAKDKEGFTVLHTALCEERTEIAKLLIEKMKLAIQDLDGDTALHYVAKLLVPSEEKAELARLLIGRMDHKDLVIQNEDGNTALHKACSYEYIDGLIRPEVVRALAEKMGPHFLAIQDNDDNTALHLVSGERNTLPAKILIRGMNPNDLNLPNRAGEIALYIAAAKECTETVKELIQHGAVCMTALNLARNRNSVKAIRLLEPLADEKVKSALPQSDSEEET